MKLASKDLLELYRIWSIEVLARAASAGTWDDVRTKEAVLIRDTYKRNILERMKD